MRTYVKSCHGVRMLYMLNMQNRHRERIQIMYYQISILPMTKSLSKLSITVRNNRSCKKYLTVNDKFKEFVTKKHKTTLRKKRPYSELFSSIFFRIRTEYWEILPISPYSVRIQENTDQNNSEYGHFLRSAIRSWNINYDQVC